MNVTTDIVLPDFKLSGEFNLLVDGKTYRLSITNQRQMIPIDYVHTGDYTPSVNRSSKMREFVELSNQIPRPQSDLFISVLGRKDYYDEILLCMLMNVTDKNPEGADIITTIRGLYNRLLNIIENVITLTAGKGGSRRKIYKHYFYAIDTSPKAGDGILSSLIGIELGMVDITKIDESTKVFIEKLSGMKDSEDLPDLDIIDLTEDDLKTLMSLLPKDSLWLRNRQERITFFDTITNDIISLISLHHSKKNLQTKYDRLLKALDDGQKLPMSDLLFLSEMKKRNELSIRQQKIDTIVAKINAFANEYDAHGTLRYGKSTLLQSSTLLDDYINSELIRTIQTFKARHKSTLIKELSKITA